MTYSRSYHHATHVAARPGPVMRDSVSQERATSRIAIVDDDVATRMLLGELLVDEGYEAMIWDGIADPLTFVRAACPAVAIVDLHIGPAMDQDSAPLHELLMGDMGIDAAVIICSADAIYLREHSEELEARGFTIVEKPFNLDDVLDAVRAASARTTSTQHVVASQSALSCD